MSKHFALFFCSCCFFILAKAQFPYYESFKNNAAPGIVIGGTARLTAAAGIDANGEGYLRLTDAAYSHVGYVYSEKTFPSYYGISGSYEFFTYKDQPYNQADGFTFFLYDASVNTFRPGAFGGALGYAQRYSNGVVVPGLAKGFIGIGVDEYGNYSTNLEGKSGPVSSLVPSSIVVRGPGDGVNTNTDYVYKAGVSCASGTHAASSFLGFSKRYPDSTNVHYRRVKFILTPGSSLSPSEGYTITVIMFRGSGIANTAAIADTLINNLDYPHIAPRFLKYGLAGSTGGATDVHEIRSVTISPTNIGNLLPPVLANDVVNTAYNTLTWIDIAANDASQNKDGSIDLATVDLDPNTSGIQKEYSVAGKGTFKAAPSGMVSFVPVNGFTGTCTLSYMASDNYGMWAAAPATISITVKAGTAPVFTVTNPPAACAGNTVDITSSQWRTETTPGATYDYFATLPDATANTNNINAAAAAIQTGGTYYIRATLNGVYAIQPIVVQFYQKPSAATAGSEQFFCTAAGSSNTTTLLGNTPATGSGKWSFVSGPDTNVVIMTPYSPSAVVQNLHVGTYTFRWTISNGPCDWSSATVKVNFYAEATIAVTPASRAVCNTTTDTLRGNTPVYGVGSWTQTGGPAVVIDSANKPTAYVKNMTPGNSYTFRYTIANGICKSWSYYTDSSLVNTAANAGKDQNISASHTVLNGNTPGTGNAGKWTLISAPQGNTATITEPSNPASAVTGFNKFGRYTFQWTINNGSCNNASLVHINFAGVLPVTFVGIQAASTAKSNLVNWQVANTAGITHFEVQRSTDGIHFTPAGQVAPQATSLKYAFTDAASNVTTGRVYYRVAAGDANGTVAYSAIVSVTALSATGTTAYAWPNPFKNKLQVMVQAAAAGKATLVLYTAQGQIISETSRQVVQGANTLNIAGVEQLGSGVYMLRVQCGSLQVTQKIIKE